MDWAAVAIGALGAATCVGAAWAVDKTKYQRKNRRPLVQRTDLAQTAIEPDRNGQRVTRNPDSESHRRKTFSSKRRGSTEAHFSQPRKNW